MGVLPRRDEHEALKFLLMMVKSLKKIDITKSVRNTVLSWQARLRILTRPAFPALGRALSWQKIRVFFFIPYFRFQTILLPYLLTFSIYADMLCAARKGKFAEVVCAARKGKAVTRATSLPPKCVHQAKEMLILPPPPPHLSIEE